MSVAFLAALVSAVLYGVAATLESRGAKAAPQTSTAGPRALFGALRQVPFLIGIGLSVLGFVCQFLALHSLPVFVVQAMQASSLMVTAVAAIPILRVRLGKRQWIAVTIVCIGLVLLAASAAIENITRASLGFRTGLLIAAVLLSVGGLAAGRLSPRLRPAALGTAAGLGFGVAALAARSIAVFTPAHLLGDPATYALAVGGLVGFGFLTQGLQAGAVTTVTAAVVVGETVAPALIGVLFLGDRTRPGFVPVALLGFVAAIAGALLLALLGNPKPIDTTEAARGEPAHRA